MSRGFWDTNLFIPNDARLHSKHVEGVQFIVSLDRAPEPLIF
jgi:hypothetical protein